MQVKYQRLVKDTMIFALGSIGSKFIVFFLVPLYTNCLTEEQYGIADLVFTIAQIFIPVVSLVVFDAVIRFGLENRQHPENVLNSAVVVWLFASIISLLLVPLCSKYLSIADWKWYLYCYVVFNILLSIELNYLKVKDKNLAYSLICIFQTLTLALSNIYLLLIKNFGISGYLISNIAATVIATVLAFIYGGIFKDLLNSHFDKRLFIQMIKYSSPLVFNNLAWWVIQSSDKVMIQIMVGEAMLGLYTVATRIPSIINVVVSVFQQSWGISAIVEMDSENETRFYSNVFKMFVCAVFFACILLNTVIKYFMKIYVGELFYEAWTFVPLLVCAAAFSAIAAYFGSMYGALKKSINNMVSTVTSGILNILINLFLIPLISVDGAVIGTVFSYFYLAIYRLIDCNRFVNIKINIKRLLLNCVIIIIHAVVVSMDIYVLPVSIIFIFVYVLLNRSTFKMYVSFLNNKRKER